MTSEWANMSVLLGMGGSHPGVDAFNAVDNQMERIVSLPEGQSVYAIAVAPDGGSLVAGTRSGMLYWRGDADVDQDDQGRCEHQYAQGAGVLSMCFLDLLHIAVSDTSGRCLIWQRTDTQPQRLPTGKRTICSLFRLDCSHLVGLSMEGKLLVWDWSAASLVKTLDVPVPPTLSALVKLLYWPQATSLVWPGCDGNIVLCELEQGDVRTICAHAGNVYSMELHNGELLTIGKTDGRLKHWRPGSGEPVGDIEAPEGVVSASICNPEENRLLLIDDDGRAGVYDLSDGELGFVQRLSGQDYRIAFGPDVERFKLALRQEKTRRAREIAAQIRDHLARGNLDGLDGLHQQLIQLDHEHVSLVLRAEEAKNRNDLVLELGLYKKLAELIPEAHAGSKRSLLRYAALLASVWQLPRAYDLYKRISAVCSHDRDCAERAQRLAEYVKAFESGGYVVEADIPISTLIRSAEVLDEPFTGRYLMKRVDPPINCGVNISSSEFVEGYENGRRERRGLPLPPVEEKELWWLSDRNIERITLIILADTTLESLATLEFGITLLNATLQTVVIPVVLFNVAEKMIDAPVGGHNQLVLERLERIEHSPRSSAWLKMVYGNVNQVIRQLVTRRLASRNRC